MDTPAGPGGFADDVVTELSDLECWEELRRKEFGRLAFHLLDEVHILPINYAVDRGDAEHPQERLVFRTGEGSKLLGTTFNPDVAFEIDDFTTETAMSVVLRGRVRELHGDEALMTDQLPLRPWVPSEKHHVLVIEPAEVTGRRFRLERPWLSMTPHSTPRIGR